MREMHRGIARGYRFLIDEGRPDSDVHPSFPTLRQNLRFCAMIAEVEHGNRRMHVWVLAARQPAK